MRKTLTLMRTLLSAALATVVMTGLVGGDAQANGSSAGRSPKTSAAREPVTTVNSDHVSVLRIRESDGLPQTRVIRLGRNKATLVELPRELRDVMVSAPEIMDAVVQSSNRVHLIGKKLGQSNAFFFDANGEQILTLEVMVEHDTTAMDLLFKRLIPGSNIKSEMINETIVLTGSVRSPSDSNRASDIASRFVTTPQGESNARHKEKVINMLAVEGEEQVMLRVTVAEVQRELLKQFGINLAATLNAGNFSTQLLTANALPLTAAAGLGALPVFGVGTQGVEEGSSPGCTTVGAVCAWNEGPADGTFGNSGPVSSWSGGNTRVRNALRALERDGLMRTLAEPNLTAISGETAKFLAGGEFPIPVIDSDGKVTVMFKEFGVGVAFTPVVLSEGRISLKIETEVSELSNSGAVTLSNLQIPALKKRQAKSTVELPSGGSLAMAGLLSEDTRQNIDGFPGLKDLPVLGTLFRSRDFIKKETELVVIVTPYLVRPTARQDLARPSDGLAEASDMKANFLGHLNRIYGRGQAMPAGDLKGDYGFIVD
jgi:pilus assembly protein CpaC